MKSKPESKELEKIFAGLKKAAEENVPLQDKIDKMNREMIKILRGRKIK